MKLTLDFKGDQKGFALEMDMECDIKTDAEALGYVTNVLFNSAQVLADYMAKANPVYGPRLSVGVAHSEAEKVAEGGKIYPFTRFLVKDE